MTGAAGGIGGAIAARLERDGWRVLAVDLSPTVDGPGEPFAADLATREGNRAAVDAALERFGRLDAIVANAGFRHVAPVDEFPEERWEALLAVLLTSPFLLARYGWRALAQSGDGRFLAVASVHGLVASPFKAGYVAAKHGTKVVSQTLRLELFDQPVRVCEIAPGMVRTDEFTLNRFRGDAERTAQVYAGVAEPLVAEDVADAVAWAVTRPPHVNVDEIVVKPLQQASQDAIVRK